MKPFSTERSPSIFSTVFIHSIFTKKTHRDAWNHIPLSVHQTFFPLYSFTHFKKTHRDAWNHFPLSVHQTFFPLYSFTHFKKTHDAAECSPNIFSTIHSLIDASWCMKPFSTERSNIFSTVFIVTKKTHRDAWNHFPLSVHQAFFPFTETIFHPLFY